MTIEIFDATVELPVAPDRFRRYLQHRRRFLHAQPAEEP